MVEGFSHLFLPGPSDTRDDYSNPRRGGSGPRLRPQDRPVHAEFVRRALETAWAQAEERRAVAQSSRNGVYLEFASEPGFDLVLKSLESRQVGIKLLNVRIDENDGVETTRATVFIPTDKSAHFLRKAIESAPERQTSDHLGWMLCLKLAITGTEPRHVLDYRRQNPDFPHQSTRDQLCDEAQFESYRSLGHCSVSSLFREEIIGHSLAGKLLEADEWFGLLAGNLLADNDEAIIHPSKPQ